MDQFVLYEGALSHRGYRKPLQYERWRASYAQFEDKIVHIVSDETELHSSVELLNDNVWKIENEMRRVPLAKYEAAFGRIDPATLIFHGDVDEIPSRRAALHVKHCELQRLPTFFECDFYEYSFNWVTTEFQRSAPIIFTRNVRALR